MSTAAEARKKKRKLAYLQTLLKNPDCPVGLQSCPIIGSRGAYEVSGLFAALAHSVLTWAQCLDTDQELTSCGGCASDGTGEDCSSMLGVSRLGGATCVKGECEARQWFRLLRKADPDLVSRLMYRRLQAGRWTVRMIRMQ